LLKFKELGLSRPTLTALNDAGYTEPTEIQTRTINVILSGKDILASAQTGSGKTAAFVLPIVDALKEPATKPRALILVPTRELALQVTSQFKILSKYTNLRSIAIYGGVGMAEQTRMLQRPVDIIIATPGRLIDFLDRRLVDLKDLKVLVVDEADRLLDLGFAPQLRRIMLRLPKVRQTLMFSATIDARVANIAREFTTETTIIKVQGEKIEADSIDQQFMRVQEFGKDELLLKILKDMDCTSVLVFTMTKRKATWVTNRLRNANVSAEEIHGDISQNKRERTLRKYRDGEIAVLVATDVAARGLDIPTISHVINYDLPNTPNDYVHRIGRTGRAGRTGTAVSFISEEQRHLVRDIERAMGHNLDGSPLPLRKPAAARRFRPRRR
jgi:ATP-dependent RNA helicase RhlE